MPIAPMMTNTACHGRSPPMKGTDLKRAGAEEGHERAGDHHRRAAAPI